ARERRIAQGRCRPEGRRRSDASRETHQPGMKFCANNKCRCHIDAEPGQSLLRYIEANGETVEVFQFRVIDDLGRKWNFCEICANVLAITSPPKQKSNEQTEQKRIQTDAASAAASDRAQQASEAGAEYSAGGKLPRPDGPEGKTERHLPSAHASLSGLRHRLSAVFRRIGRFTDKA